MERPSEKSAHLTEILLVARQLDVFINCQACYSVVEICGGQMIISNGKTASNLLMQFIENSCNSEM